MNTLLKKIRLVKNKIYYIGLIILLFWLAFFVWRMGTDLTFNLSDIPFHLATAAGFARAGGIVAWDFWESLPLGRAHNYPPLFHIIFANFLKLGLSPTNTAKFMMEFTIVGGFLAYIWGISKLFNIKVAFWSVFFTVSSLYFIRLSATVMPATLTLFLVPALFYAMSQKKWISYVVILIFIFYLHLFLPYIILLAIFLYLVICDRDSLWWWLKATVAAFVCYLPWLVHVLSGGFEYIKYFDSSYSVQEWLSAPRINLTVYALSAIGFIFFLKEKSKRTEPEKFIWIMFFIFLGLAFLSTNRVLNGNLLLLASLPAALAIIELRRKNVSRIAVLLLVLAGGYCTQYLSINGWVPKLSFEKSSFLSEFFGRPPAFFAQRDYETISRSIGDKTVPGDSIVAMVSLHQDSSKDKYSQMSIANYWAVPSKLSTLNLRQPEIYHRSPLQVSKAKILISSTVLADINTDLLRQYGYDESDETLSQIHSNFSPLSYCQNSLGETIYFYINNSSDTTREVVPASKFGLVMTDIIIVTLLTLLINDLNKLKLKGTHFENRKQDQEARIK